MHGAFLGVLVVLLGLLGLAGTASASSTTRQAAVRGGAHQVPGYHGTTVQLAKSHLAKKRPAISNTVRPNAVSGHTVSYGPITAQAHSQWTAWVNCPSGTLAAGGGESNTSPGGISLHDSYALSGGGGWQVAVTNDSAAQSTFTVYGVCLSGLTSYGQVLREAPVPANSTGTVGAYCSGKQEVLGGGGSVTVLNTRVQDDGYSLTFDQPYLGAWRFIVHNFDAVSRDATAQVLCGVGITTSGVVDSDQVAPGQLQTASESCSSGTTVLSGGGGSGGQSGIRITDSYPDGNGWRMYVMNDDTQPGSITTGVHCGF